MKLVFCAALGFALGLALAHFETHPWPDTASVFTPKKNATAEPAAPSAPVAPRLPPPARGPTLRTTVEPVYRALFALDDLKAFAVAVEESAAMEPLLAGAPRDALGDAARRLGGLLKGVRRETERAHKSLEQPTSTVLGGGGSTADFFDGIYDRRWRAAVAALAKKAAPEWQRLAALDAVAAYPPEFQTAIARLLAERRVRDLERTATLIEGTVAQAFDHGALIRLGEEGGLVFVEGLKNVADDSPARVLAHRDGVFKFKNTLGEQKTVWKLRYYRDAD